MLKNGHIHLNTTMLHIHTLCQWDQHCNCLVYSFIIGVEAFNQLHQVVERLVVFGQSQTWGRQQEQLLKSSKQYIQSDYKVCKHTIFKMLFNLKCI